MQELRPGLWTWTAHHPDWRDGEEWGPEVRSYAYDTGGCLVLFDPLSPPTLLEGLVEAQEIGVLLTAEWHRRSADDCVERFGAHVHATGDDLPADVELASIGADDEVAYWIPRHRALVIGDVFTNEGRFRVMDHWVPEGGTPEQVRDGVRPLLELPVELVLLTHGDPVLEDGREAMRAALA
ncbi:MAG TPA: hypothetical protein VE444_07595 [Gaiellaceae bacterium]|nr:hypothetical protein [Gaiellaceae bacterium]